MGSASMFRVQELGFRFEGPADYEVKEAKFVHGPVSIRWSSTLRTTSSQKCEAVPRGARGSGS